ncbi:hypothetical protein QE392_001387 [Microbacterium proteolyticum]|uniref:hypothetical protein n=1 Tax=Microbacterium proteolyticum TaxID=1572644 RepID=UPI002782B6CB|nr:hypothetical protein [Microbacterium proteolyticum]MDQ1169583.1 hypothetical protein [Microbacterium proteolyticum]
MANPSPIQLDCSPVGIVVACEEHPWWRAFRFHKEDAWNSACAHEEREHGDDRRQRHARDVRRARAKEALVRCD